MTNPLGTGTSSGSFTFVAAPTITSFTPAGGGPVRSTVTVTGTNLTGATHVALHSVSAAFSVLSATTLTFTVPVGATTGTIAVTTPGGTATSGSFTVTAQPPTITSFSPGSGPVGTSVTITGTNLTDTVGVMIGSVVTVPTTTGVNSVTFTIPPGAPTGQHLKILARNGSATSAGTFTVTG